MQRLHDHPIVVTLIALAGAGAVVLLIAWGWGFHAFVDAWSDPHYGWLPIAILAELAAIGAYVLAYRSVAQTHGGPRLPVRLAVSIVTAGFGPFAIGGGFALDKRALYAIDADNRGSSVRVLGLGALEWALLAPATWLCSVLLLVGHDPRPMKSLLWPWAIAVPVGFALGLWLTRPSRRAKRSAGGGRFHNAVGLALDGVGVLHTLAGDLRRYWPAWVGIALYWVFDICSFYAAARFIGLHITVGETVLAYATGYALTRRSMPLGGAGATEALLTFALHWVGQPLSASLAAVVVYRLCNFALPTCPALFARARVEPLLIAADRAPGSTPAGSAASAAVTT